MFLRRLNLVLILIALFSSTSLGKTVRLDDSFSSLGPSGGAIVYSDFVIDVGPAWLDSSNSVDSDLRAKGIARVLTNVSPSTPLNSAFGLGRIRVVDGLMTKIKFQYGVQNDVHLNTTTGQVFGGFTGYVQSEYYGHATPSGTNGLFTNSNGVFKQFALNEGQPTGPVELEPTFADPSSGTESRAFNEFYWTTGSAFADPTTPTRSGKSEVGDISVTVVPAKELLANSISRGAGDSKYNMRVTFQPRIGIDSVPLKDLASALEVESFNWKQIVTGVPRGWKTNIASTTWSANGTPTSINMLSTDIGLGFTDHIVQDTPGVEKTYVFTTDDTNPDGTPRLVWWRQELVDNKEPYWDLDAEGVSTDFSATFSDTPKQPAWSLNLADPLDKFTFETRLVGVKSDGTIRDLAAEFPKAGLKWTWSSNAVHVGDVIVNGQITGGPGAGAFPSASNTPVPDAVMGEVFDVSSDYVPPLIGDYDNNGSVGPEDYDIWKSNFGTSFADADGNEDGIIDSADYTVWRDNLGAGSESAAAVPEPSLGMLIVIACIVVLTIPLRKTKNRHVVL